MNPTVSGTSYTLTEDLGVGRYRTWLRTHLSAGGQTSWDIQDFHVSLAPQLNDILYRDPDRSLTISWNPVPGATGYRVYISNLTVGGSAVADELVSGTNFTPAADLGFGRYRIWCRAIAAGNYAAAWSTPEKYYVGPDPVSPSFSTFNAHPTFTWGSMPGISTYQLYVTQGNTTSMNVSGLTDTSYTPPQPLGAGSYRWWIRPFHESGRAGDWSDVAEFYVGGRPEITGPAGHVMVSTPTITWETVEGAGSYDVYLFNDSGLGLIDRRNNITETQLRATPLTDGDYRVWVKSYKANGAPGLWSRSQNFTVNAVTSQVSATPVAPLTATFDLTPTFVWSGLSEAVSYDLYLTDGIRIIEEFDLTTTSFTPATDLAIADCNWWVRAVDGNADHGEWSAKASVHVGGRPTVLSPTGSTSTTSPTIRWTTVDGAGR